MDIDALHSALLSFTLLSTKLRYARENKPVNKWTREDFAEFLKELDRDLRVAVATFARELGFSICDCCWPPEVLATNLAGEITALANVNESGASKDKGIAKGGPTKSSPHRGADVEQSIPMLDSPDKERLRVAK